MYYARIRTNKNHFCVGLGPSCMHSDSELIIIIIIIIQGFEHVNNWPKVELAKLLIYLFGEQQLTTEK